MIEPKYHTLGKKNPDADIRRSDIEEILVKLAVSSRNSALDAAARVAKLYGAPDEACERILMLKGKEQ